MDRHLNQITLLGTVESAQIPRGKKSKYVSGVASITIGDVVAQLRFYLGEKGTPDTNAAELVFADVMTPGKAAYIAEGSFGSYVQGTDTIYTMEGRINSCMKALDTSQTANYAVLSGEVIQHSGVGAIISWTSPFGKHKTSSIKVKLPTTPPVHLVGSKILVTGRAVTTKSGAYLDAKTLAIL